MKVVFVNVRSWNSGKRVNSLLNSAHTDENALAFSARSHSMHEGPAALLGRPREQRAHDLHDDVGGARGTAGEVGMAEARVDGVEDDEGGFVGGGGGDGADGEELEELADLVAGVVEGLVVVMALGKRHGQG